MKSLKAAAVVAGSMVIVGVAVPAFANDASDLTPTSLNGGLDTISSRASEELLDVQPLHTDMLDTEHQHSLVGTAQDAVDNVNEAGLPGGLLGGLPLQK
ncbi:hypothetical protein [Streptomyces sp. NPDC001530]|uniref:hypothetical protein n=1 Tax=Streptomyces sp. NPDC001530 TaxID=3364582 RepID=UPI0036AD2F2C